MTSPESNASRPERQCNSVVLPHPEGPTMATTSPRSIDRLTPRRAGTWTLPSTKVLRRLRASITGPANSLAASSRASFGLRPSTRLQCSGKDVSQCLITLRDRMEAVGRDILGVRGKFLPLGVQVDQCAAVPRRCVCDDGVPAIDFGPQRLRINAAIRRQRAEVGNIADEHPGVRRLELTEQCVEISCVALEWDLRVEDVDREP